MFICISWQLVERMQWEINRSEDCNNYYTAYSSHSYGCFIEWPRPSLECYSRPLYTLRREKHHEPPRTTISQITGVRFFSPRAVSHVFRWHAFYFYFSSFVFFPPSKSKNPECTSTRRAVVPCIITCSDARASRIYAFLRYVYHRGVFYCPFRRRAAQYDPAR